MTLPSLDPLAKVCELTKIFVTDRKAARRMSKPADRTGPRGPRRMRGFEAAAGLLRDPIRKAGETRGFAVTRLLTHWPEVAGPDLAPLCRPVNVSYAKQGLGATLTLLTSGAAAPLVQMQADKLRERVNAIYGYAAIARIRVTQTSARGTMAGLAEAQRPFDGPNITRPSAQALARAQGVLNGLTEGVADSGLKSALERLATQVFLRQDRLGAKGPAGDRKEDP